MQEKWNSMSEKLLALPPMTTDVLCYLSNGLLIHQKQVGYNRLIKFFISDYNPVNDKICVVFTEPFNEKENLK